MDVTETAVQTTIRQFLPEDKPPIMAMLRHIPQFTAEEVEVAEELIDCFLTLQEASGYHLKTAVLNSTVAGYVCYGPTPLTQHTWDMYWLAVNPEIQKQGIGGKLMTFAEEQIKKARGKILVIETSSKPNYESTRRFHQKLGYKVEGKIADFYDVGDDKLLFIKRI